VYDLDAHKVHRRVYGIATGFSAAIWVRISHSFAAVDRQEVNSCLVFHNRRCHLQQPVLSDTAAILPRFDSTANFVNGTNDHTMQASLWKQMHITPESAAFL